MSIIMEEFQTPVNALEEVRKLQDLVRKLEIQNFQLKNRHNTSKIRPTSPVKDAKIASNNSQEHVDNVNDINKSLPLKDEYFDDLEVIRVSDIEMSDDESWLYTSPKSAKQNKDSESPYKWLRKDVDDPENKQLQLTKKALLTKLTELDILSPMNKSSISDNPTISNLRRTQMLFKSPLSVQNHDPVPVDSRTFTRSKKKEALEFLEKLDFLNREKCSASQLHRRPSNVSCDSVSSCHVLEDASDVEEAARLQEESLRMNSPLGTPKRGSGNSLSSRKISTSSKGSASDLDVSETSAYSTQNAESPTHEFMGNNTYPVDSYNNSDQSSPSESPYGSNASLHDTEKGKLGTYRRSLPNLARDPLLTRQSKTKGYGDNLSHNKGQSITRKPVSTVQAVQKMKRDTVSPSRRMAMNQSKMPPTSFMTPESAEPPVHVPKSATMRLGGVKSGLPRPARASSASRSGPRSGIPTPSMLSKKREDAWSEGCY